MWRLALSNLVSKKGGTRVGPPFLVRHPNAPGWAGVGLEARRRNRPADHSEMVCQKKKTTARTMMAMSM